MPYADSDGIRIYYEVFGAEGDPLLVLISGGGAQMISWDDNFIAMLTNSGLRVVRFDNRDTGLSQRFGGPDEVDGGYELSDMGKDVLRVLDALEVHSAHLTGHSMGGMIAQMVAIDYPARVLSLGLISTIPGQSSRYVLHGERPELLAPPQKLTREEVLAFTRTAILATPEGRYSRQIDWHLEKAALAYDRGYAPEGYARQWAALRRAPERLELLRGITAPSLVVHGRDDDVLHWHAGFDTADAIPGSELQIHPDMGHLIPHELWADLAAAIVRTAHRAQTGA